MDGCKIPVANTPSGEAVKMPMESEGQKDSDNDSVNDDIDTCIKHQAEKQQMPERFLVQ